NGNGYCLARAGTGGTLDLRLPLPVTLYHELSHAFRIVTNSLLQLTFTCNPSSPEERAAITDENDMRTQLANLNGQPVVLRDPGIHCGTSCGGGGGGDSCCVVATVSSGSPLSAEVAELRALREGFLRRGEVGFAFFEALHHAYYSFSPQVVTAMAADLELRATTLHGFVRPLIRMLGLVRDRTLDGVDPETLGERFVAGVGSEADVRASIEVMDRVAALLRPGREVRLSPAEQRVATLLASRALADPHISWALVEPVRTYHRLLGEWRTGTPPDLLGHRLADFVSDWSGRLPVEACWGSMDLRTARAELDKLEATLLRDPAARQVFLRRLATRFGSVTAIDTLVRERRSAQADQPEGGPE
ncbi:MAG TPA: hypothetical protein VGD43_01570, partial [Micromonospora sp.]